MNTPSNNTENLSNINNSIQESFFIKFDNYFMKKYFNADAQKLTKKERNRLFIDFYNSIKDKKVANRETVRKWFGIDEMKKPKRIFLIKLAFALNMSSEELNDYITQGISEPCLQVNDYKEFMAMYCLDNNISFSDYEKMIKVFEDNYNFDTEFEYSTHTNRLKKQYESLKTKSRDNFIIWVIKNMSLFKGYSKVTYDCFLELMNHTFAIIKENIHEALMKSLEQTDFKHYVKEKGINENEYNIAIPRYVKNKLRMKDINSENDGLYREIRNLAKIAYSQENIMKESIKELWPFIDTDFKFSLHDEPKAMDRFVSKMNKFTPSHMTNLIHIKEQKQEELKLISEYNNCNNSEVKQALKHRLQNNRQRIKQINRIDLLIPAHYVSQHRYLKNHDNIYDSEDAKKSFISFANGILNACGMRELDNRYETDYIILSSFENEDVTFISDLFDE